MSKCKYSEELKLEVIQFILKGNTQSKAVKKYLIDKGTIQKWLGAYQSSGVEGLLIKENNPNKYTGDFKVYVIKYMYNNNLSIRQTAAYFNIPSYTSVSQWKQKYDNEGEEALYIEKRGAFKGIKRMKKTSGNKKSIKPTQTEKELLKRIKTLEMENEYLKKLNALVQEKEKSLK